MTGYKLGIAQAVTFEGVTYQDDVSVEPIYVNDEGDMSVKRPLYDGSGNPVLDADGNPTYEHYMVDASHQTITSGGSIVRPSAEELASVEGTPRRGYTEDNKIINSLLDSYSAGAGTSEEQIAGAYPVEEKRLDGIRVAAYEYNRERGTISSTIASTPTATRHPMSLAPMRPSTPASSASV